MTAEETTAQQTGNTKAVCFRARAFLLTLNEIDKYQELYDILTKLKSLDYLLSAKEKAPTTGHEHIHIYIHFESSYKLSKKILSTGVHVDICRGSPKQNIDYVSKCGDILHEEGTRPHQGVLTVQELQQMNQAETPAPLLNIKKKIDQEQIQTDLFNQMFNEIKNDDLKAPEVIYITGDAGKGKTYTALKKATEKYQAEECLFMTFNNNFGHVRGGNQLNPKCLIIDELRPSDIKPAMFLQLTDKYVSTINIKGGQLTIRPQTIIISSIKKPCELYQYEESNDQIQRRITQTIIL